MNRVLDLPKRLLVGRPLRSEQLGETLLPKRLALPVFCSDPLSSVAYATEEILLVLALGGLALLHLTWVRAAASCCCSWSSSRPTGRPATPIPSGGGAYAVSRENLGRDAALIAASALLVDYVMTVAVSVVAGVAAITSAVPALRRTRCRCRSRFVVAAGPDEPARRQGVGRSSPSRRTPSSSSSRRCSPCGRPAGDRRRRTRAESARPLRATRTRRVCSLVLLVLRAFASGCTALTGVEAVSNGVPAFRRPKSRNAATTLAIMGALASSCSSASPRSR